MPKPALIRCQIIMEEYYEPYVMRRDWGIHDGKPGLVFLPEDLIMRWEGAMKEFRAACADIETYRDDQESRYSTLRASEAGGE